MIIQNYTTHETIHDLLKNKQLDFIDPQTKKAYLLTNLIRNDFRILRSRNHVGMLKVDGKLLLQVNRKHESLSLGLCEI